MRKFSTQSGSLSSEKRKLLALRLKQKGVSTPEIQVIPQRATRDPCPLSFAQQRLWFLDQLEKGSTAYLIPQALSLRGELHVESLRRSLSELVQRHESLRTTFPMLSDQPVQVVHSAGGGQGRRDTDRGLPLSLQPLSVPTCPLIDLREIKPEQRGEVTQRLVRQEAQHPMRLAQGPLLRTYLLRLQMQEHVLLLTMHHIITDEWSNEIVVRELTTLYRANISGQPSPLAPLPIQYADYAIFQRDWLQGEVLEEQLAYWRKQLGGLSPLAFPTDHPRPPMQAYRGAAQSLRLSPVLSEELMHLCRKAQVTPFMLGLAAFQIVLMRYTGQTDISVGTPITNRRRAELKGVIGFFVNTLVMRTDLSGNPTFQQTLQRVRQICLEAYAHQDIPFEKVVEALEPERDLSRSPLFQVMFVFQNIPVGADQDIPVGAGLAPARALSEVRVSPLPVENPNSGVATGASQFDLTLSLVETRQGLHCSLRYNTDLFEVDTITRLLTHFQTLLEGIVHNPQARVSELPLLTEGEREQILVEWNATQRDYPQDTLVHQLFEVQVQRTPDAVALVFEDETLTYAELNRRANQLAHYLRDLGVSPDRLIGICMERCIEMIVGLLAVLKAGGGYVPLDPMYPKERLAFIIQEAGIRVLLIQEDFRDLLLGGQSALVCIEREWGIIAQQSTTPPEQRGTADQLAYVLYTSGSTGHPKGVMVPHRGLVNYLFWAKQAYAVSQGYGAPLHSSMSFDLTVTSLFVPLTTGQSVLLLPESQGVPALTSLLSYRRGFHLLKVTPSHLELLRNAVSAPQLDGAAQVLILGGEALSFEHLSFWQNSAQAIKLFNEYGPTETVVGCCIYEVPREAHLTGAVPIGRPIANMQMYILDQDMQPVPVGVSAELYVGGVGVTRGYLKDPKQTAERFVPDPFVGTGQAQGTAPAAPVRAGARLYRTGDLVRYRKNGDLEFVGRTDQQVKLRGYRIELGEIETTLREHEAIADCVVVLREEKPEEKRLARTPTQLVAYTVLRLGHPLGQASDRSLGRSLHRELHSYLQERLPTYMLPSAFVQLEALPLTPNGKLDRRALPAPAEVQHAEEEGTEDARTPIEELLVGLWEEVLGQRRVHIHQNFFELGGHSLLATQLIARVRATLGIEVPLRALFEAPTVAEFAQRVEQVLREGEGVPIPPLVAVPRPEQIPLSFAQQRLWFLDQLQPGRTEYLVPQTYHLSGSLSTEVLERSLSEMIRRHESLRTTFTSTAGQLMQIIHPAGDFRLPLIDLCELEPERKKREAWQLARQEAHHPCDLEKGPLLRTALVRLDHSDGHVLLLTQHHIITDGWSNNVLRRELVSLYQAYISGQPSPLPPLPLQYADYAIFQREFLRGEVLEAKLDYWTRRLAGAPPIELPTDHPRPSVTSARGATHHFVLPQDLTQALQGLSRKAGMTLFMVLLTAFKVLCYRTTGQLDIVVGTDSANRQRAETEGIIGFFINLLALRTNLSGKPTFQEVLLRVREVVLGAYTHQDMPFELLVEKLAPDHYLDRTPLIQALFVLQNTSLEPEKEEKSASSAERATVDQVFLRPREDEETLVKFDLAVFLWEREGSLFGAWNYRLDLFKASTIATLVSRFEALLQSSVNEPDLPIDLLRLSPDAARVQREQEQQESKQRLPPPDDGWFDLPQGDFI